MGELQQTEGSPGGVHDAQDAMLLHRPQTVHREAHSLRAALHKATQISVAIPLHLCKIGAFQFIAEMVHRILSSQRSLHRLHRVCGGGGSRGIRGKRREREQNRGICVERFHYLVHCKMPEEG